jgi:cytochrome c553
MKPRSLTKRTLINLAFITTCLVLLLVLYLAPEETTAPLPADEIHNKFRQIESKKEADALCFDCHSPEGGMALPDDHPNPFRCLFCHKR